MSASRVEAMLHQLEPAFLTAVATRFSAVPLTKSPEFAGGGRKSRVKEELAAQIAALSAAADDKEDALRRDIDEVEVRLEGVLAAKRRVVQEQKYSAEAVKHKKEGLLATIQKLQKQYDDLEEAQHTIESGLDSDQVEKLNAFKSALRPLEDAEHAIKTEKDRLTRYNEQFNERLLPLQESLHMTREDIRAHVVAMEDALQARKVFESQLTVFKEKHEEELADFLEELETREMLKSIRSRKAEQIEKVKKIDKKIVENEKQLSELRGQLNQLTRHVTSPSALPEKIAEIEELEMLLLTKEVELGLPPLSDVVMESNKHANYDIEEAISRAQIEQLDKKERMLEEEWKDEVMTLEAELAALQSRLAIDEKALAGQIAMGRTPDGYLEKTCREEKEKAAAYIESITELKTRNRRRSEAISRWKLQHRVNEVTAQKAAPVSDSDVLVAYAEAVAQRTSDPQEQEELSSRLRFLSERLQTVTEQAGMRDERLRKRREAIDDLSSKVQSAEFRKASSTMERNALQKELTKLITTEKAVSKRFEQMKMKAESSQKRAHEDLLSSELSSRSGEMSMIFKTMGNKAQQRLADKTKQELARTVTSRQRDRRARLEEKYQEYESWDRVAHWHTSAVEETLRPQYEKIAVHISSLKRESERLKEQLQAILEAEDDLSVKTESIIEQKRKVLRMTMNQTAKALQAHVKTRKLEVLKTQLIAKVQKLEDLERGAADNEAMSQDKLSEILLEEAQLKTRLSQLQGQMTEVSSDRDTVKDLEKRFKVLSRDDKPQAAVMAHARSAQLAALRTHRRSKSLPNLQLESLRRSETGRKTELPVAPPSGHLVDRRLRMDEARGMLESGPKFEIKLSQCTKAEAEFFAAITALLEGILVLKKSGTRSPACAQPFDPLEDTSPELFDYSLKELRLSKPLSKLEFRQPQKPGVDYAIMTSQLLDPLVPKLTKAVVSAQRKTAEAVENAVECYREMKEKGTVTYSSAVFIHLSKSATFYPFTLHWAKGGKAALLARSVEDMRRVCEGVQALLRHGKDLARLKYKIE